MFAGLRLNALRLTLLLVPWAVAPPARAQWIANGVPLSLTSGGEYGQVIAPDGAGGAIVVWRDGRNDDGTLPVNTDIYAQHVTARGAIGSGWDANGTPVCTAPAYQDLPSAVADGAGGAYVAWVDQRHYDSTQTDIYMQRLTRDGRVAPGWTANGDPVCTARWDQYSPKVARDGSGGVFVAWEDFRRTGGYVFDSPRENVDIYVQRMTPEGTVQVGWPVDGLPVCAGLPRNREGINLMPDGSGGVFIQWIDDRSADSTGDIYALRILGDGSIAPGWVANGVPVCTAPGVQGGQPGLVSDGQGGFISEWVDARSAPAGVLDPLPYVDIYAQRMTAAGTISPGWIEGGVPVCTAPDIQQSPEIVSDGAGGAIVAWEDYRNYFPNASDIYAQRVLGNGTIAPGWPVDGALVSGEPGFEFGRLAVVGDGVQGAFVGYGTYRHGDYDVYVQHVTAAGSIAPRWDGAGESLCNLPEPQQNVVGVSDGHGGMIAAWEDDRAVDYRIYAQHVTASGSAATPNCDSAVAAPAMLWPPDHKYVPISISGVTDADGDSVAITVTSITQDEPVNGRGDGNTCPDAQIVDGHAFLRAEREGAGNGRVYTLTFTASNPGGGSCSGTAIVCVPRETGGRCIDDGQRYNSLGSCTGAGLAAKGLRLDVGSLTQAHAGISFSLPNASHVELAAFDVAGRRVGTLEDNDLPPGVYQRSWDMLGVPNGVYFVRLLANGQRLTKTLIKAR